MRVRRILAGLQLALVAVGSAHGGMPISGSGEAEPGGPESQDAFSPTEEDAKHCVGVRIRNKESYDWAIGQDRMMQLPELYNKCSREIEVQFCHQGAAADGPFAPYSACGARGQFYHGIRMLDPGESYMSSDGIPEGSTPLFAACFRDRAYVKQSDPSTGLYSCAKRL
jgi:hypothetical protein